MMAAGTLGSAGALELWDTAPVFYSEATAADPIAKLAADLGTGKRQIEGRTDLEKLRFVLNLLGIPIESQVLVFSKTSHQNALINPKNPRCLFYNENAYVGFVPGGAIEIAIHDSSLGTVFYLIDLNQKDHSRTISRDTSTCLSCHASGRTESVPGVLVRSVRPDASGHLLLHLGTELIDATSPINVRWGGYYVTGHSSLPHLGNRVFDESGKPSDKDKELRTLTGTIDTSRYLRDTSDIVSLMVLEHQCRMHNLLVAASMEYRRSHWFQESLGTGKGSDPDRLPKLADSLAVKITDAMLFKDEASMGDTGVDGDPLFQDTFGKRFPKSKDGLSLADFQLSSRIFKHRCSYMIYSQVFANLPTALKSAVFVRLRRVLEEGKDFPEIKPSEREKISRILKETIPGYSEES